MKFGVEGRRGASGGWETKGLKGRQGLLPLFALKSTFQWPRYCLRAPRIAPQMLLLLSLPLSVPVVGALRLWLTRKGTVLQPLPTCSQTWNNHVALSVVFLRLLLPGMRGMNRMQGSLPDHLHSHSPFPSSHFSTEAPWKGRTALGVLIARAGTHTRPSHITEKNKAEARLPFHPSAREGAL